MPDHQLDLQLRDLYLNDKLSLSEIAKKMGCSTTRVRNAMKRTKSKMRSVSEGSRIHNFNESYFEKIDSHEKAQFLGFIAADGCVLHSQYSKSLSIGLSSIDFDYLENLRKRIEWPITCKLRIQNGSFNGNAGKFYTQLVINSKKLGDDLNNLGILPRKSLAHEFPTFDQVPNEFIKSYILGYFEGDGCLYLGKSKKNIEAIAASLTFCCSDSFASSFKDYIKNELNIFVACKKAGRISYANITGNVQVENFLRWMYSGNCKEVMRRKREKCEKFLTNRAVVKNPEYVNAQRSEASRKGILHRTPMEYKRIADNMKLRRANDPFFGRNLRSATLKGPDGKIYTVFGVLKFIEDNKYLGLKDPSVSGLISGRLKKYKGFTLVEKLN